MAEKSTITVTRETLEATPARVVGLLRGVARKTAIRARLQRRGYTQEEHDKGFNLLRTVLAYVPPLKLDEDTEVRDAMVELNKVDEDLLSIVGASLKHEHPEAYTKIMAGLDSSREEGEALFTVSILLERLNELEKSDKEDDKKALEKLAARGIDDAERKRLAGLVEAASRVHKATPPDDEATAAADQNYLGQLEKLRAWFEEWSEIARATIKRRDHLILLGLARRRSGGDDEDDESEAKAAKPAENAESRPE